MNKGLFVCLVFVLVFSSGASTRAADSANLWQELAPGISYRELFLPGPNHVYVTRLERANSQAILETSLSQGRLGGGLETVREQAERYDQALGFWGARWGVRNRVIVAVNGGFFDPDSGLPINGLVHSGWYVRRFENRQTIGAFAWRLDRLAFVSECIVQPPGKQQILLPALSKSIPFDGINQPREADQVIIYTPQFGPLTPEEKEGLEILVELAQPLMIMPASQAVEGTVREIRQDQGSLPLPFDHIVLSAGGKAARALAPALHLGDRIEILQELRHLDGSCRKERQESWQGAYAGMAGGDIFLKEGVLQPLNDLGAVLRNPRTGVALNDRYVFFIVVDGRDQLRSLGMSMVELGVFAKQYLNAVWGLAMDGGGSSTMVVNGKVVNNPNAETVVRSRPDKIERVVANSLLMVVVEPEQFSKRFQPGQNVSITEDGEANLRLGPGTNYAPLALLSPGSQGMIQDHSLNGIQAKGYFWWKVDFGGTVGWASESVLKEVQ